MKLPVQETHPTLGIQTDRIDVVIPGCMNRQVYSTLYSLQQIVVTYKLQLDDLQ